MPVAPRSMPPWRSPPVLGHRYGRLNYHGFTSYIEAHPSAPPCLVQASVRGRTASVSILSLSSDDGDMEPDIEDQYAKEELSEDDVNVFEDEDLEWLREEARDAAEDDGARRERSEDHGDAETQHATDADQSETFHVYGDQGPGPTSNDTTENEDQDANKENADPAPHPDTRPHTEDRVRRPLRPRSDMPPPPPPPPPPTAPAARPVPPTRPPRGLEPPPEEMDVSHPTWNWFEGRLFMGEGDWALRRALAVAEDELEAARLQERGLEEEEAQEEEDGVTGALAGGPRRPGCAVL